MKFKQTLSIKLAQNHEIHEAYENFTAKINSPFDLSKYATK
jgi:hypothetical protein